MPQSSRILCFTDLFVDRWIRFLTNCLLIVGSGSNLTEEAKSGFRGPDDTYSDPGPQTTYYTNTPIYHVRQ
jgi:hypothetical protein